MMYTDFKKIVIGSGLLAEMYLDALINFKGEQSDAFYVIGENIPRCRELMQKYKIKAAVNPDVYIKLAKEVIIAVDPDRYGDIPRLANSIRDKLPADTLITSVTHDLKVADIEAYFPDHAVMRLAVNLPIVSGAGIGAYFIGSKARVDTDALARYIMSNFSKIIETKTEFEFETIADSIFALTCGMSLILDTFINSGVKSGMTPQQSREVAINVAKGVALTFEQPLKAELMNKSFDYKEVYEIALNFLRGFDILHDLNSILNMQPDELEEDLKEMRRRREENEKFRFHYKW